MSLNCCGKNLDSEIWIWHKQCYLSILSCINGSGCFCGSYCQLNIVWTPQPTWVLLQTMTLYAFMTTLWPSSNGFFQQYNTTCHKAQITSVWWFLQHVREFTKLKRPPQSSDLSPVVHIWDVLEWEICRRQIFSSSVRDCGDVPNTLPQTIKSFAKGSLTNTSKLHIKWWMYSSSQNY